MAHINIISFCSAFIILLYWPCGAGSTDIRGVDTVENLKSENETEISALLVNPGDRVQHHADILKSNKCVK